MRELSQHDYEAADPAFRLIVHEHPRKYASLSVPKSSHFFVLCWRSHTIDPIIVGDDSNVWVGVDQRVVCLGAEGNILFSVALNTNVVDIVLFSSITVVLCETEAIVINANYSLSKVIGLREVPDKVAMPRRDTLTVTFIGGETETFSV